MELFSPEIRSEASLLNNNMKNKLEMGQDLNVKPKTVKLPEDNRISLQP